MYFWGKTKAKFFIWKIWFQPKQRICQGKNGQNSQDFEENNSKLLNVFDKFQQVVKNIFKICFFYIHI